MEDEILHIHNNKMVYIGMRAKRTIIDQKYTSRVKGAVRMGALRVDVRRWACSNQGGPCDNPATNHHGV